MPLPLGIGENLVLGSLENKPTDGDATDAARIRPTRRRRPGPSPGRPKPRPPFAGSFAPFVSSEQASKQATTAVRNKTRIYRGTIKPFRTKEPTILASFSLLFSPLFSFFGAAFCRITAFMTGKIRERRNYVHQNQVWPRSCCGKKHRRGLFSFFLKNRPQHRHFYAFDQHSFVNYSQPTV